MADNKEQVGYLGDFLGAVADLRGLLVDKLTGEKLGTTGGGNIGALGALVGLSDAIDTYMKSDRGEEATNDFAFDFAGEFGWLGPVDWTRDKLGEIFDRGPNEAKLTKSLVDFSKSLNDLPKSLPEKIKDAWDWAKNWVQRRDPLTLDLDGDGIETVGISSTNPILFDHDGDGIKNGTGWVAADDGMLVLDRNGNGSIDSGRELFGDSTIKSNGQVATNGFNALADIDSNADGMVNSTDTQYANLRIWRDLNQDGTSQTGELFTLASQNITAIHVASTLNSQTLANGNQVADLGTYTKTDGSKGVLGEVTGDMADINLADDTFHRSFPNVLDTSAIANLPDMQGSGAVRDLREAATQSATLQNLLTQYSAATTRAAQMALIDPLLDAWADTSGYKDSYDDRIEGMRYVLSAELQMSVPYSVNYEAIGSVQREYIPTYVGGGNGSGFSSITRDVDNEALTERYRQLIATWNQKIHILESFNGNYFFGLPTQPNEGARSGISFEAANSNGGAIITNAPINIRYDQAQLDLMQQSYDALRSSVYDALLLQTRFKPLLDQVNLVIDSTGIKLDFTQITNSFTQKINANAEAGLLDLIDFNIATKSMLKDTGWNGWQSMANQLQTTQSPAIIDALKLHGAMVKGTEGFIASGTIGNDVIIGNAEIDYLSGGEGNDILMGLAGDDSMDGGNGSDTYVIGIGDGIDTINDTGYTGDASIDSTTVDVVQLAIKSTDITALLRVGNDLVIQSGTGDQLTITYQLSAYHDNYGYGIEQLQFSDGVTWTQADILSRVITNGSNGDDNISGLTDSANRMYGLEGNDYLTGGNQADIIEGGAGDDTLSGGAGSDLIKGGTGADTLDGGNNSDTYVIGIGDGIDTITDTGYMGDVAIDSATVDVVQLAIKSTDITALLRVGNDLVIQSGTGDQLTITYQLSAYHDNYGYGIEQLQFSDGVTWTQADIKAHFITNGTTGDDNISGLTDSVNRMYGFEGNDYLVGGSQADIIDGGAGNDTLTGNDGNDTLNGGAGNDLMEGGNGNDAFVIGVNAGIDTISDYSPTTDTDIVQLAIKSTDITGLLRVGYDLVIQSGTGDQLTITYQLSTYHDNYGYGIEQLQFSDGVTWTQADITARVITNGATTDDNISGLTDSANRMYGLEGNDYLTGGNQADTIDGGIGDDNVHGNAGNDSLLGGAGNDTMSGGEGNDTLVGGIGNDNMDGGYGNDTFVIGTSAGVDSITDYGDATETDIVQLAIKSTDITALLRVGNDLVIQSGTGDQLTITYQLSAYHDAYGYGVEQLQFSDGVTWTQADITARVITNGTTADDNISGLDGATNRMYGFDGNDYLAGGNQADIIEGGNGDDTLSGNNGSDSLLGGAGNDALNGNEGNDSLNGGAGNDVMEGGNGSDTYAIGIGDGIDTINDTGYTGDASIDSTTVDVVQLAIKSTDITALLRVGNDLVIQSGTGDQLTITYQFGSYHDNYGYGVEQLQFSDGVTWTQTDILTRAVENLVLVGTAGNDTLIGNVGNDSIDGGAGADTMQGGKGDDTYFADNTGDVVTENLNEGTDNVQSAITYTLTTNVENLTLTGTAAINGSGNTLNNVLTGNSANNTLNGGTGADTMMGGLGNDTYVVDNIADVVTENAAEGTDTVQSSITYTLGTELENLTLTGTTAINGTGNDLNNSMIGNAAANTLTGGLGNDTLNGGAGADTLIGGVGNDVYVLDSLSDVVTENAGEGTDTVQTAVTLTNMTLAANVENLTLTGTAAINGWGNDLNNTLTGNTANNVLYAGVGNDTLNGGTGADTLVGGLGNDIYVLDNVADIVTENLNEGTDTVQTAITLGSLANNVENITLTGTAAVNATGNDLNNVLTGNSAVNTLNGGLGNDTLNGAAGADTMVGGAGNDIYVVDNAGDVLTEIANEGTDTIQTSVTLTSLAANVEILNLTGTTAINGVGNSLSNFLKGNTATNTLADTLGGNDILQGLAGSDVLNDTAGNNLFDGGLDADTLTAGSGGDLIIGGKGNDTITTGTGYDVISFNKGDGADVINASTGADNTISLGGAFAYTDLSLTKTGNDLIVKMGTTDQLTLKDWYLGTTNKSVVNLQVIAEAVTGFTLGGANTLRNNKVENFNFANLVAAYDAAGATANWQLTDARLTAHLLAGSDTAAIGGDLAYQYGRNSNLTGVGLLAAQNVINNASFGQNAQTLNNPSVWSAEVVKLG